MYVPNVELNVRHGLTDRQTRQSLLRERKSWRSFAPRVLSACPPTQTAPVLCRR